MNIEKYKNHHFEDGGSTTTKEYTTFQNAYIKYLKEMCEAHGWTLTKVIKSHYQFSVFIKDENYHYVYLSICDVRYFHNKWYDYILVRGAVNDEDYKGLTNEYTDLPHLTENIERIFRYLKRKDEK